MIEAPELLEDQVSTQFVSETEFTPTRTNYPIQPKFIQVNSQVGSYNPPCPAIERIETVYFTPKPSTDNPVPRAIAEGKIETITIK